MGEQSDELDTILNRLKRAVTEHQAGDFVHAPAALWEQSDKERSHREK